MSGIDAILFFFFFSIELNCISFVSVVTEVMSRSDYPPAYDSPPYAPQGGPHQPPPAYGFPAYGVPQPGPPTAPYPNDSNTPLFPGQPGGGYPPAAYSGQPYPYGHPGAGYPAPPPMPPVIPPTLPSGVLTSGKNRTFSAIFWVLSWTIKAIGVCFEM